MKRTVAVLFARSDSNYKSIDMLMPEIDPTLRQSATDWVEIAPAIRGWVDCWARLSPSLKQDKLCYLADRLEQGKEITPRLVEQSRAEFEEAIALIPKMEDRNISNAVLDTRIAWEIERAACPT